MMSEFDRIVNRSLKWTSWGLTAIFVTLALLCVWGGIESGDTEAVGYSISLLTLAFMVCPGSPARSIPLPAKAVILVIAGILL
jgi:hypothetical protein